jgi:hypothetical protein
VGGSWVGVGSSWVGVGDTVTVGSSVDCSAGLAGSVALDGTVGLGDGLGVVVGCWIGTDVGVRVAMGNSVLVACMVGTGVGVNGSPNTNRAAPGILCTASTAATPAAAKRITNSETVTRIQRFLVVAINSFSGWYYPLTITPRDRPPPEPFGDRKPNSEWSIQQGNLAVKVQRDQLRNSANNDRVPPVAFLNSSATSRL